MDDVYKRTIKLDLYLLSGEDQQKLIETLETAAEERQTKEQIASS